MWEGSTNCWKIKGNVNLYMEWLGKHNMNIKWKWQFSKNYFDLFVYLLFCDKSVVNASLVSCPSTRFHLPLKLLILCNLILTNCSGSPPTQHCLTFESFKKVGRIVKTYLLLGLMFKKQGCGGVLEWKSLWILQYSFGNNAKTQLLRENEGEKEKNKVKKQMVLQIFVAVPWATNERQ